MPQVGQCTLNPPIAPLPILLCQAHNQSLDLFGGARSPRCTMAGSIVLLGDQFAMPSQQRLWRNDRGNLRQKPMANPFRLGRQTSALAVVEPKPLPTKLCFEDPILFTKIVQG